MLLTLKTLCAIFTVVAIVYFLVTEARRPPPDKSVKLSNDEFGTLVGVANYALKKLGRPTPSSGLPTDLQSMDRYLRSDMFNPISELLPRYLARRIGFEPCPQHLIKQQAAQDEQVLPAGFQRFKDPGDLEVFSRLARGPIGHVDPVGHVDDRQASRRGTALF